MAKSLLRIATYQDLLMQLVDAMILLIIMFYENRVLYIWDISGQRSRPETFTKTFFQLPCDAYNYVDRTMY